jgi:hypothetical protein
MPHRSFSKSAPFFSAALQPRFPPSNAVSTLNICLCTTWPSAVSFVYCGLITCTILKMQRALSSRTRSAALSSASRLRSGPVLGQQVRFAHKVRLSPGCSTPSFLVLMISRSSNLESRRELLFLLVSRPCQRLWQQPWDRRAEMS